MTLAEGITARRADTAFTGRLDRSIERNRRTLERLAAQEGTGMRSALMSSYITPAQRRHRRLDSAVEALPQDHYSTDDDMFADTTTVADFLRRRGIQGRPGGPCSCPVAQYFSAAMGADVMVDGLNVSVIGDDYAVWLPLLVRNFIADFDQGMYPDLCIDTEELPLPDRIRPRLMDAFVPLREGSPA
jgi:hypothetical protein